MKVAILKAVGKVNEPMQFCLGNLRKRRNGPWVAIVTDPTIRLSIDPLIAPLSVCSEGENKDVLRVERWSGKVIVV